MIEKIEMSEEFKEDVMKLRREKKDTLQDIIQRSLNLYRAARDAESKGCKVIFQHGKVDYVIVVP